jgi:hypothetical protein
MLTRHLSNRKFPCRPQVIPATFKTHAPKVVHSPKILEPIQQIDPEADLLIQNNLDTNLRVDSDPEAGPSTQNNLDTNLRVDSNVTQKEIDYLIALGLIEELEIEESWLELGGTLLDDKAKSKIFKSCYMESAFNSILVKPQLGNIIFEEAEVGDPDRPNLTLTSLTKWQAIIPSIENPAYEFNTPITDPKKYAEAPYMPHLIAVAREQITSVLKAELRRKDQIKSKIVVYCTYMKIEKNTKLPFYDQVYHSGEMRAILSENDIDEHITLSTGEIDAKIEAFLDNGSGWTLIRIEIIYIEVYTFRRATGGSYKPTPEKLANTKCTINPDNSNIIDPITGKPSDNCLIGALGCYFAEQDGHIDHLGKWIFTAKKLKKYLDRVNLDGIPMPTPICPRTFQKIEA